MQRFQINIRRWRAFQGVQQFPTSVRGAGDMAQDDLGEGIPCVALQGSKQFVSSVIYRDGLAHARRSHGPAALVNARPDALPGNCVRLFAQCGEQLSGHTLASRKTDSWEGFPAWSQPPGLSPAARIGDYGAGQ